MQTGSLATMTTSIDNKKADVLKRLQGLESWEERYKQILFFGKKLPPMDEEKKIPANLVRGCLSKVWLSYQVIDGKVHYQADSEAAITKGIIALLLRVYSGELPQDILALDPEFLKEVGISDHLSMNRRNGLVNMVKLIMDYARENLADS